MRILGLDIGDRTIGVAVCDPLGITAQGITTIRRKNEDVDIEQLKDICNKYDVESIVSGLPKNMNGTLGPQSKKVIEFCKIIEERIKLPIKMWDERLTTVAANRAMLEADLSRKKRKKIVDKMAATYILQGYLDSI
ncbi:Holliday junction resolvase RuvX [Clostridium tyrobutyricum]|jgi:putative Holliday junction resolvase|uniref:Putative pre-16S rRNA nuclease n=1 Tax=Clostridium tyrobutyricum DIVETGP TaxID=1408889 RepID=W6NDI1_CLOTY|nr:Holliday junction resolvase RuvX [Clostridium tyrobutyricum]AND85141.1 putative pre-16S rRNA nuclease [Clostridium tyrobutyricum]ANP69700.1 Holliday junction DNA helicase RuvA [Clostridium tyrobutyricum]MBR9646967.1 Holliday junction resolvase RuvX [Clostridium tyrobutyricum]MBV4415160.1 Holliday junction resolvase RuvX [Clostridium tyrobutyricum]MBV4420831.1 Holliday junction resolvase RuvX [Clostridium tyrobutyricum]